MTQLKVAIYARVSTEEQDLNNQLTLLRAYCERMDYQIFNEYKDVYTGTKANRPGFNILLEDMRAFKFDAIIVTKLDRIGRSLQHLVSLMDEFKRKKVNFVAVTQNIDTTTSMGTLQWQIMGAFAEFERNLISERTREGLAGKANVGKRGKDKKKRRTSGYHVRWARKGGV